jgi:hypothetical protein
MSVGTPARLPLSTSAFFTHSGKPGAVQRSRALVTPGDRLPEQAVIFFARRPRRRVETASRLRFAPSR